MKQILAYYELESTPKNEFSLYLITFNGNVLLQYYPKQKPKVVFYRKYRNFRNDLFRSELENELSNYDINNIEYDIF